MKPEGMTQSDVKKIIVQSLEQSLVQIESDMQLMLLNLVPMLKASITRSLNGYLPEIEGSLQKFEDAVIKYAPQPLETKKVKDAPKAV